MQRRTFIRNTGIAAATFGITGPQAIASLNTPAKNKLPKWKGFNLTDFFNPDPSNSRDTTTEDHFRWMRDWGFDFVRLPIAYPWYLNIDRTRHITPEETYKIDEKQVEKIDKLIAMAHKYNQHVSINLHRAPGYCVNAGFNEPFNLWRDQAAQDAFYHHWAMWAKRYKNTSAQKISFDLLNEPSNREDMNDQHSKRGPVPGDIYRKVAKAAAETIRKENPNHLVIADDNNTGSDVIPEILDLNNAQKACFHGRESCARWLIENGAELDAKSK